MEFTGEAHRDKSLSEWMILHGPLNSGSTDGSYKTQNLMLREVPQFSGLGLLSSIIREVPAPLLA